MDIGATLASISAAVTIVKELKNIDQNFDQADFRIQISELMNALADVKFDLSKAKNLLVEKDNEIEGLKQSLTFRDNKTINKNGYTYGIGQDGKNFRYPYCQVCEQEGKYIIIQIATAGSMLCPKCSGIYDEMTVSINPEITEPIGANTEGIS